MSSTAPVSVVPAVATTATGMTPCAAVLGDRLGARVDVHAPAGVDRDRADLTAADAEHLGGAAHGVVRLRGAVQRHPARAGALVADARERPFAGRGERGQVRDRPARREQPAGVVVEADELADPADRLRLEQIGGAGAVRDVDVVRGHQRVGEHPDLESRGTDIGEPPRPRLRERPVENVGGGVERFPRVGRRGGQRAAEQLVGVLVGERLARTGMVEAPPRLGDQLGGVLEHLIAVGQWEGWSLLRQGIARGCHRSASLAPARLLAGPRNARSLQ